MADGRIVIDTLLNTTGIKKDLEKLGSIAQKGCKVAVGAIAGISTALGGAGAAAIKVGSEFKTALAKTSTMFGDVQVDTDKLSASIISMSNETGVAASQIGESLYNALSAGIPVTEDMGSAMDYMGKNAKLAKAGFTDIDTTVTATAKVLNAYKMDVSETDKVHKILIQTQNKGITTVGELGAVLAQVTPTAAAMNVSFEQIGAALATMTAQGTPTAQATTQLNSLLAELGKEGTNASKILEKKTGKSFKDLIESGMNLSEILSIMQVNLSSNSKAVADLMGSADKATGKTMTFEQACSKLGLSSKDVEGELINMFGSLEAGKAALAMSGQNAEQFTTNLQAMKTETDVVGDAYAKVMDTFAEKSKIFIENAKNLGIAVYENMDVPLKKVAEEGTKHIEQLADALKNGGLDGLVAEVGSVLADVATKVVSSAPTMVKASTKLISSFVDGIVKNLPEIAQASKKLVDTLVSSLISILPKEIQRPLKDMVGEIKKALSSDSIKSAIKTMSTMFTNLGTVLAKVAKTIIPPLVKTVGILADNLEFVLPLITGVTMAVKAWSIVQAATTAISAMAASWRATAVVLAEYTAVATISSSAQVLFASTMSASQLVIGVLTGKVTLATAAMALFNTVSKANVIGVIVTAVLALVAAFAVFSLSSQKQKSNLELLNEANKNNADTIKEETDAYNELMEAQNKQIQAGLSEIDHTKQLADELDTLVDKNGKIKKGYEDRANFIVGELSKALGIEIKTTDGVIDGYKELSKSIDILMEKKRAQVILDAQEPAYRDAIENETKVNAELRELRDTELKAQADYNSKKAELDNTAFENQTSAQWENLEKLEQAYDLATENRKGQEEQVRKNIETIARYETDATRIASGNQKEMEKVHSSYAASYEEEGKTIKLSLQQQLDDEISKNELTKQAYEEAKKNRDTDTADTLKSNWVASNNRKKILQEEMDSQVGVVNESTPAIVQSWNDLNAGITGTNDQMVNNSTALFNNMATFAKQAGVKVPKELQAGIASGAMDPAEAMAQLNVLLRQKTDENVKAAKKIGISIPEELKKGIESRKISPFQAMEQVNKLISDKLNSQVKAARAAGVKIPKDLAQKIKENAISPEQAMAEINSRTKKKLDEQVKAAEESGIKIPKKLAAQIKSGEIAPANALKAINALIKKEHDKAEKDADKTGKKQGKEYSKGIGDSTKDTEDATKKVTNAGIKAAEASIPKWKDTGTNLGKGIGTGITSSSKYVEDATRKVIQNAESAAKKEADIHSPSKKFEKEVGAWIPKGVAAGITKNTKYAKKSATQMSSAVLTAANTWIKQKKATSKVSIQDEIYYWEEIKKHLKSGTAAYATACTNIKKLKKQGSKDLYDSLNEDLQHKKDYDMLNLKMEADARDNIRKQLLKGTDERKQADLDYYNAKKALKEKEKELDTEYLNNCKSVNTKLKEDIQSVTKEYNDALQSRKDSIMSSFGLFDNFESDKDISASQLISNQDNQLKGIEDYEKALKELERRGVKGDLLTEIKGKGASALGQITAMLSMTDTALKTYIENQNKINKVAMDLALTDTAPQREAAKKQIQSLTEQANKDLEAYAKAYEKGIREIGLAVRLPIETLKTSVSEDGKVVVTSFSTGIQKGTQSKGNKANVKKINSLVTDSLDTLKIETYSAGQLVVDGLVEGINSKQRNIELAMANMINAAKTAAQQAADIHSPSKLFEKEIGKQLPIGAANGVVKSTPVLVESVRDMIRKASSVDISNMASKMQATVNRQMGAFANTSIVKVALQQATATPTQEAGANNASSGTLTAYLNIDGRQFATASAPYMDQALGKITNQRKRGG